MNQLLEEAQLFQDDLIQIRRTIHQNPELGNQEYLTSAFIRKKLQEYGIDCRRILDTGVLAYIKGKADEPCVMIRSDLDALPIEEKTGLPFASVNKGKMHACGHDMHIAALLGAARLLENHHNELCGSVKLIFEPDEEGDGGAERLIQAGVLLKPYVSAVFGAHCNPDIPAGKIGIKQGEFYAAAGKFDVIVHGKGSHAAEPEKGTDSIYAAARMIAALKEMTAGQGDERMVVSVGTVHAGTARNIIPDEASFSGILRICGTARRKKALSRLQETIEKIAVDTGTKAEIHIEEGYPGVVNHLKETDLFEQCAVNVLGRVNVIEEKEPTMTTEDFGCFLLERPGCFWHIGVGPSAGLHSPEFNPDENALAIAAALHAETAMEYLKMKKS